MITTIKTISDSELGEVFFRKNSQAKRYIIRYKDGKVTVTIPWLGNLKTAEKFLSANREKLLPAIWKIKEKEANKRPPLNQEELILLRQKAEEFLPGELERLATVFNFRYSSCRIGKSRTQWGSCSTSGTIRLSLYIALLPKNLIQYILLHELCHTVHHNHGKAFWQLLDQCTGGNAKELRKELKKYYIPH